ncbi:hypothetical protein BU15DRAFT_82841 [Melanogaster broomeanus]|nr:hypothetical protein BU15DRAFT_82841 [Melanogaster broomeanus]
MSDLELLVFVSRVAPVISSVQRIVEYLDLLREPQSSSSPAVHHQEDIVSVDRIIIELITYGIYALHYGNTVWNPITVFEWFTFTWVHVPVGRALQPPDERDVVLGNEMTVTSRQLTMLHDRRVPAHARDFLCRVCLRTPRPPSKSLAIINSNRLSAYWISSSINNPLISADDLVIKHAPELRPTLYQVSCGLKARERTSTKLRTPVQPSHGLLGAGHGFYHYPESSALGLSG